MQDPQLTQADLADLAGGIIEAVEKAHSELDAKIDRSIGDVFEELRELRASLSQIEEALSRLEKNTIEDSDAFAREIVALRREVGLIQKRLTGLES